MTNERQEMYKEMEMLGYNEDEIWAMMESIDLAEDYDD